MLLHFKVFLKKKNNHSSIKRFVKTFKTFFVKNANKKNFHKIVSLQLHHTIACHYQIKLNQIKSMKHLFQGSFTSKLEQNKFLERISIIPYDPPSLGLRAYSRENAGAHNQVPRIFQGINSYSTT